MSQVAPQAFNKDDELTALKQQAEVMARQIQQIHERIRQLEPNGKTIVAHVDSEKCTGCGICVSLCPNEAIVIEDAAAVDPARCSGCGACVYQCPMEAIYLVQNEQSA